jgi:GTP cyclohydrolase I
VSKKHLCYELDCSFEGEIDKDGKHTFILGVKVPVTTLCPCSKEISEFGAHNQRALIKAKISYPNDKMIWIEDLINAVETCASAQVYPILKREDEKFVNRTRL